MPQLRASPRAAMRSLVPFLDQRQPRTGEGWITHIDDATKFTQVQEKLNQTYLYSSNIRLWWLAGFAIIILFILIVYDKVADFNKHNIKYILIIYYMNNLLESMRLVLPRSDIK